MTYLWFVSGTTSSSGETHTSL